MKVKIPPVWEDYKNWECYKNGMYNNGHNKKTVEECKKILTSKDLKNKMKAVTHSYPIATKVNFTNQMFNPISWLGQATCNLFIGSTAQETCQAWMCMSKEEQTTANNIAKEVIREWELEYENI